MAGSRMNRSLQRGMCSLFASLSLPILCLSVTLLSPEPPTQHFLLPSLCHKLVVVSKIPPKSPEDSLP